jgi:hypothetical protein
MTKKVMKRAVKQDSVLGNDVNIALRELVRVSKKLIEFADQESQALLTNDHITFAFTQRDKESLSGRYAKASEEFRSRLDEFRHADKGILMQLDQLQRTLKEKTANNNEMISQIKKRASANTQSTLFAVQELGQRVQFDKKTTQEPKRA